MNSTKFDNFLPQEFSFPKPLILSILENANSSLLKKLNKTCKYLFIKRNITIIDELTIFDNTTTEGSKESISGFELTLDLSKLDQLKNNLWITDELRAYYYAPNLSSIVNKIVKCDINYLDVLGNITFNEFKILTASGNIEQIHLFNKNPIQYSDGTNLVLDDLLLMIPKASVIEISNVFISKNTPKNLSMLKHQAKIRVFFVDFKQKIDVEIMNKFFMNNLDDESAIEIRFNEENDIIGEELYDKIQTWKPEERKPKYMHLGSIFTPDPNEWPFFF
uniref:F-box domain-containing protein n=1 Tax=Panagrolaimus davidi TaxID=227884 RepID=A0A914QY20_9BILA